MSDDRSRLVHCRHPNKGRLFFSLFVWLLAACQPVQPITPSDTATRVDLVVGQAGIYTLRAGDLAALGFSGMVQASARLRLSLRGIEQPYLLDGSGEDTRLVFFGQSSDSRYSQSSVYVLELLDTASTASASGNSVKGAAVLPQAQDQQAADATVMAVLHLEENNIYNPQSEIPDHWLWQLILGKSQFADTFDLPGFVDGPASIQIELWSNSQANLDPDHHMLVILNDIQIGDFSWDGRGVKTLQANIPPGVLRMADNTITLLVPGDTGAPAELDHLDSLVLTYTRSLEIQDAQVTFLGSGTVVHPDTPTGRLVVASLPAGGTVPELSWLEPGSNVEAQTGVQYWLAPSESLLAPAIRLPRLVPDLHDASLSADYLAIGPQDLLDALAPLLTLRQSQGWQVMAVPIDAIYDQFGGGFPEPGAVTEFLRLARGWHTAPAVLLLVGDATYDPAEYTTGPELNRLPVFFVQTSYGGETASDLGYALLDQDSLPDVAVGRLPASTPEQVSRYVEKVLAYEAAEPSGLRKVLAVSDGTEPSFQNDAQEFLSHLGPTEQSNLLASLPGDDSAAAALRRSFQDGLSLVAYFGHGSVTLWGKDKIFSADEALDLTNQQYPIVMTMTCLNGLFTHPKTVSLAENLLWSPKGGAVAVLAPSSLTLAADQAVLRHPFVIALFSQDQSLGQALLSAQRSVSGRSATLNEVVATFLLFGDPALKLK